MCFWYWNSIRLIFKAFEISTRREDIREYYQALKLSNPRGTVLKEFWALIVHLSKGSCTLCIMFEIGYVLHYVSAK